MSCKTVAVIDIASNELRLKIAERKKDKIHNIEAIAYPLSLGKDTFHAGKISFEKMEKTSSVIKGFQNVMKEYAVEKVRAIATTAIREAGNKEYILDQIKIKTGIDLEVMDDSVEKNYVNKITLSQLSDEYKQSSLLVHLGSGNIAVSVVENSLIKSMQNIKIGALRLSNLFEGVLDNSFEYPNIIKEYLQGFIEAMEHSIPKNIKNFIITGTEIKFICELCNGETTDNSTMIITREAFIKLYKEIKSLTPSQLANKFNITLERADVLLPVLIVYNRLLKYTKAESILSPGVSLSDGVIYELLLPENWKKISDEYDISSLTSAKEIAQKFDLDINHTERVSNFALKIFDKLKKLHGLGKRERLLLNLSSTLHNVGKFINVKQHYIHSYEIIRALDLVGLNQRECLLVAVISLFHSRLTPSMDRAEYAALTPEERVLTSKLCAILRLADSLNRSHDFKFDDIDVRLNSNELIITVVTNKDIELEMWAFASKAKLFEDVYGIKAVLKKRRVI